MEAQAVSAEAYKRRLYDQFRISRVHNYYGMAEQTGCVYMECEAGHLHASIFPTSSSETRRISLPVP